jgi:hypothetical protein
MLSLVLSICAAFRQCADNGIPRPWTTFLKTKQAAVPSRETDWIAYFKSLETDWIAYYKSHGPRSYSSIKSEPVISSRITDVPIFPISRFTQMHWAVPSHDPEFWNPHNIQPKMSPVTIPMFGESELLLTNPQPTPKR